MDTEKIRDRIEAAFFEEFEMPRSKAKDIAFHMTDWTDDIQELAGIFSDIDRIDNEQLTSFILRFLAHVPNHLNAAKKLSGIGMVEDVFNAGIFVDDE